MTDKKEIATVPNEKPVALNWDETQRKAMALSKSDLIPKSYQNNVSNCLIALEVAQRCNSTALQVMQNLNIIHGKPSWSSAFIIAAINSCGRFEGLKFKLEGSGETRSCYAYSKDKDGEIIEGPRVTMAMAKAEGWVSKAGSKWVTMPDLMLSYRAASFFGRLYASEILLGMRSDDEEREIVQVESETVKTNTKNAIEVLNAKIKKETKQIENKKEEIAEIVKPVEAVKQATIIKPNDKTDTLDEFGF